MNRSFAKTLIILLSAVLLDGCASLRVRNLERKKDTVSVITYNLTTTINAPVKDVWELTKLWNTYTVGYAEYDKFSQKGQTGSRYQYQTTQVSQKGLTGIGNHSSGKANLAGRKVRWNEVVVEWEDERTVRFVYSGDARGSLKISMQPAGDKTLYSFSGHIFFLPDSILAKTLNSFLEQGILGDYLDKVITEWIVKDIARLEKKKPEEIRLDKPPVHNVFVNAYLRAGETFGMSPQKLFKMLNSPDGLKSILPVDSIVPAGNSPHNFEGLGNHYLVTATQGLEKPLSYDMVIVQYDPPREARYYLYSHGVCMEMDVLVTPTIKGSKALILFIMDMPESIEGQALDVMIHISDIDKKAQQGLARLKNDSISHGRP